MKSLKTNSQKTSGHVFGVKNRLYKQFLEKLDKKLQSYFDEHKDFICCKAGCSACCEKGDYPISQLELEYLMQGFISLDNETKIKVQENIKSMVKGGKCPFLISSLCSVYPYRPIICRVHGLVYLYKEGSVKVPYCVNYGKNYSNVFENNEITINPVLENLDTTEILKEFNFGEIRNLFDWLNSK